MKELNGLLHEIWREPDGKTMLCLSESNDHASKTLIEEGSELVHSFYAASHHEAMTIYYEFMGWGKYTTTFEADKQPYKESSGKI